MPEWLSGFFVEQTVSVIRFTARPIASTLPATGEPLSQLGRGLDGESLEYTERGFTPTFLHLRHLTSKIIYIHPIYIYMPRPALGQRLT